jgi:peptidoglycan hydrolase CwlO-like protein
MLDTILNYGAIAAVAITGSWLIIKLMRDNNIHNRDFDQQYNTKMTTKQDVQKQIKDLESQISTTSDQNEKRNLESQRDNLKQQLENL